MLTICKVHDYGLREYGLRSRLLENGSETAYPAGLAVAFPYVGFRYSAVVLAARLHACVCMPPYHLTLSCLPARISCRYRMRHGPTREIPVMSLDSQRQQDTPICLKSDHLLLPRASPPWEISHARLKALREFRHVGKKSPSRHGPLQRTSLGSLGLVPLSASHTSIQTTAS